VSVETPTILLVEDDVDHAELVRRGLRDNRIDCEIDHVLDGEVALDYLFHRRAYAVPAAPPRPALILLDLRLPKMGGLEVLREIKESESLRSIPTVILTSSDAERDVAQAYSHHANSYVVKPVDFTKFSRLMEDLGLYWLSWNHREPVTAGSSPASAR
jgi:two-component system, response regulator